MVARGYKRLYRHSNRGGILGMRPAPITTELIRGHFMWWALAYSYSLKCVYNSSHPAKTKELTVPVCATSAGFSMYSYKRTAIERYTTLSLCARVQVKFSVVLSPTHQFITHQAGWRNVNRGYIMPLS